MSNKRIPMFTLSDMVKLADAAHGKPEDSVEAIKYKEAVLGDYLHTDASAKQKQEWLKTGSMEHGLDNPGGIDSITGKPGGKLPSHPTFSDESPYAISGFVGAEGGKWSKVGNKWNYTPSNAQFKRNPSYESALLEYFNQEKGNGIDTITLPNGEVLK